MQSAMCRMQQLPKRNYQAASAFNGAKIRICIKNHSSIEHLGIVYNGVTITEALKAGEVSGV